MSDAAENMDMDPGAPDDMGNAPPADAGSVDRPTNPKFESWADMEKAYNELESFRGSSIRIPSKEAGADAWEEFTGKLGQVPGVVRLPEEGDTEGWRNFYQRMGAPDSPDKYNFSDIDGQPVSYDDDQAFAERAFELGLTRAQADGLRQYLAGNLSAADQSAREAQAAGMTELKKEWGRAFDHNLQTVKNVAKVLDKDLPGLADYMANTPADMLDSNTVRMVNLMAGLMNETGAIDAGRPEGMLTPEEAMLQAQEIRDNPDHPYNNEMDPAHEAAQKKMADLYKMAYSR
jgi:hypothetical protein